MSNVPTGSFSDPFPPNQITDLQATLDGEKISLTWTAPGDDFDVGRGKNKDLCRFDLSERNPGGCKGQIGQLEERLVTDDSAQEEF